MMSAKTTRQSMGTSKEITKDTFRLIEEANQQDQKSVNKIKKNVQ